MENAQEEAGKSPGWQTRVCVAEQKQLCEHCEQLSLHPSRGASTFKLSTHRTNVTTASKLRSFNNREFQEFSWEFHSIPHLRLIHIVVSSSPSILDGKTRHHFRKTLYSRLSPTADWNGSRALLICLLGPPTGQNNWVKSAHSSGSTARVPVPPSVVAVARPTPENSIYLSEAHNCKSHRCDEQCWKWNPEKELSFCKILHKSSLSKQPLTGTCRQRPFPDRPRT